MQVIQLFDDVCAANGYGASNKFGLVAASAPAANNGCWKTGLNK
jgi:hypothetical protein